jgi:hypothetical protein
MEGCHTFAFTHKLRPDISGNSFASGLVNLVTEDMVQRAIDAINMSVKEFPDAWEFVRRGSLVKENQLPEPSHPLAKVIFTQMSKDDHSGFTASYTLAMITDLARQRGRELGLGFHWT